MNKFLPCKKPQLVLVLLLLLAGAVFGLLPEAESAEDIKTVSPIRVKTFRVGMGSGPRESYAGEIRSQHETELSFLVSGKIISCPVKAGDIVRAGDTLAIIDDGVLRQSVASARARYNTALSQLTLARKNLDRYNELINCGAVSQANYDTARQQYEAASAAEAEARAGLSESELQLGYSRLTADRDGIVTEVKSTAGQFANAGESIITIADIGALDIKFSVPQAIVGSLREGQPVSVTLTGGNKTNIQATIREISPMADGDTRTFCVKAALPADSHLRIGMTAQATLTGDERQEDVFIPRSAVFDANGASVYVVIDGKAQPRQVRTGTVRGDEVKILSGLAAGDSIIAAGTGNIYENAAVEEISQ